MNDKSISTLECDFVIDSISAAQRIDGRRLTDSRHVNVSLGPTWGFAEVSFDKTLVIASTTTEAITPPTDRSNEGNLSISVDLSPTSSEIAARDSLYRSPLSPRLTEIRNCIDKFIRDSRAIDTEALCILAGVKVWSVRVEVNVINDDGNCVDVCVLAIMSSLMHARRPDVTVTGKEVRIHPMDEREPVPLPVHHVPLSVSFALFGAGKPYESDAVVLDPVRKEEVAAGGSVSFSFNAQGQVCGVYKAGGLPLEVDSFVNCSQLAEQRTLQLTAILKDALADAASQHPLATVRPMLMNPEPTAQIKLKGKKESDAAMQDVTPSSIWNATPVADDAAPPPISDNVPMKMNAVQAVDTVMQSILEKRDKVSAVENVKQEMTPAERAAEKEKDVEAVIMSNSDSSSDDDLQSAVISKPRNSKRRR